MKNTKRAMSPFDGERKILVPGVENFGPGSYDPYRGLHIVNLKGSKIIPVAMMDRNANSAIRFDQFPLRIYEN